MKYTPAVDTAYDFLVAYIQDGRIAVGERLPSSRNLASLMGIDQHSVLRAIARLKREGIITGPARCRPVIAAQPGTIPRIHAVPKPLDSPSDAPQRARASLIELIISGQVSPGSRLPPYKELQRLTKSSTAALKKALNSLVEEDILEQKARGFHARAIGRFEGHARVVVVGHTYGPEKSLIGGLFGPEILSLLQALCGNRNLRLEMYGATFEDGSRFVPTYSGQEVHFDGFDIGYIVLLVMNAASTPAMINALASTGRPVAIIDCLGDWSLSDLVNPASNVRVFSFSSGDRAARDVAQYLLQRGHRSIAYVSPYQTRSWSQIRCNAIKNELQRSGSATEFIDFSFDSQTEARVQGQFSTSDIAQKINHCIGEALALVPGGDMLWTRTTMFHPHILDYHILHCCISDLLNERLPELLEHTKFTAWVCVNDFTGGWVLDFLRRKKVSLPGKLSVVSFDDTAQALNTGLTSYNFNVPSLVNTLLNYLLSPRLLLIRRKNERVHIPGALVERQSSGPARTD